MQKRFSLFLALIILFLFNFALVVEAAPRPKLPPNAPTSLNAISISSNQINLSWTDNSNNEAGFKIERRLGLNGTYIQIATVGANITTYSNIGLTAGTTYYYRVKAYNSAGDSAYSNEASATTIALSPTTTTNAATDITLNSATLNATVNPNGSETTAYFEWGTTTSYGNTTSTQSIGSGTSNVSVTANVTGLSPNTTYHYRIVATNAGGTSYGDDMNFMTTASPPNISVTPSTLDFSFMDVSDSPSLSFKVSNIGTADLMIGTITGVLTQFSIMSDGCSGQTLSPSASCSVTVKFFPTSEGLFTETLTIPSNDSANSTVTVTLKGAVKSLFFLPDTGQTQCYTAKGSNRVISPCPSPGNSLAQDGSYTINPPSYTINGDGTVFDNNTWIMWQQQDDGITRIWDEADNYCENLTLGGYSDWRLPSNKELESIVNYGKYNPSIDASIFPNTKMDSYWTYTLVFGNVWYVNFINGDLNFTSKTNNAYTRCVRGGPLVFGNLRDNGDGTVTDFATWLTWQQSEGGTMDWGSGLAYCEGLILGGYSDWRLPNVRELESLTDNTRYNPSITTAFFPNANVNYYWSSTPIAFTSDYNRWTVSFQNGHTTYHNKSDADKSVRCIRGQQALLMDDREIRVDPSELDFFYIRTGESKTLTLTVSNVNKGNLVIGTITSPSAPFSIISDGCSGTTLGFSASCLITVKFTPITDGAFTDLISIASNDADHPNLVIKLVGWANALGVAYLLPDTGQTNCYDINGYSTWCRPPGNSAAQDGSYTMNPPSYTVNSDGTVFDNNTWLMWQREDDGIRRTWADAVNYCENLTLGGATDWRLPTKKELASLLNYRYWVRDYPTIDFSVFPNTKFSAYWSSTINASNIGESWHIGFDYFSILPLNKSSLAYTRCVRGEQLPSNILKVNSDSTVTDLTTGLLWQQSQGGYLTWDSALAYCENLTFGGYTDWRLPNVRELLSLTDDTRFNPAIDIKFFPEVDCDQGDYWTSTTYMYAPGGIDIYSDAHVINLCNGDSSEEYKKSIYYPVPNVRCVRGGNMLPVITGMITDSSGLPLSFVTVTVTDSAKTYTITASGTFTVTGLMPGNFTATFEKSGYIKQTVSGTLIMNETKTLNVQLTPIPPLTITITSPQNNAVLNSSAITVTGSVNNNASVTVNGIQASVSNGTFSVSISLSEGQNTITAIATDNYSQTATQSITVTFVTSPTISNIAVGNITIDSATVTWTTNQSSDSKVEYGATISYGSSVFDSTLTTTHSITLTNLAVGMTYHFKVTSKNSYGFSSSSGDNTFTTRIVTVTTLGDYGNVTVMEITGNYDAKNLDGTINAAPRQEIAKEFLRLHQDMNDFFVIFSNFDFTMPDASAKAFYLEVKNNTQGIGKQIFDNSASFGSNKLQGIIDMGNISTIISNPVDSRFDDTISTLAHEQMHRWGANVRFRETNGTNSTALLGKDGTHWSFLLNSYASVLYGNDWMDNKDGTFTSTGGGRYYSPLDLYLMGMYDRTQVTPMLLIDNPNIDPTRLPEVGTTISGTTRSITIDNIIAIEGERIPNASTSQKTFKTAFILITRPGTFTGNEPQGIENVRNAYAGEFASLTNGKGSISDVTPSITIAIASPSNNETINKPYITVRGGIINTTGNETGVTVNGMVAIVYGNQFIVNQVPLTDGSNTITVTATDTAGYTATASILVNAVTTGNYIELTANPESGISPLEVTLKIDGSFSITASNINVTGTTQPEFLSSSADEYRVRMIAEGIYYFTASVTGPDGNTYQDTVAIVVLNATQLDALLRAKWEAMKTALANQDIDGAVGYFLSSTQGRYRSIFSILSDQLPSVAANMNAIEKISLEGSVAQYRIKRTEDVGEVTYYIYFAIDGNGLWKIQQF